MGLSFQAALYIFQLRDYFVNPKATEEGMEKRSARQHKNILQTNRFVCF